MQIRTINDLAVEVANNPQLADEIKENPAAAIARVAAPIPNTTVYKMVVGALGLTVLIVVIGAIGLAVTGKGEIPAAIIALGSMALGALAGLLAPQPTG